MDVEELQNKVKQQQKTINQLKVTIIFLKLKINPKLGKELVVNKRLQEVVQVKEVKVHHHALPRLVVDLDGSIPNHNFNINKIAPFISMLEPLLRMRIYQQLSKKDKYLNDIANNIKQDCEKQVKSFDKDYSKYSADDLKDSFKSIVRLDRCGQQEHIPIMLSNRLMGVMTTIDRAIITKLINQIGSNQISSFLNPTFRLLNQTIPKHENEVMRPYDHWVE